MSSRTSRLKWLLLGAALGACALAVGQQAGKVLDVKTDALPKPTMAIDTTALPWIPVSGPHHGMTARQVFANMGLDNRRIECDVHHYAKGGSMDAHSHSARWNLFYVIEGSAQYRVGDVTYAVYPGTVIAVPPRAEHEWKRVGDDGVTALYIAVNVPPGEVIWRGQ